MRTY